MRENQIYLKIMYDLEYYSHKCGLDYTIRYKRL